MKYATKFDALPVDVEMYPGDLVNNEIQDGLIVHGELTGYFTSYSFEPANVTDPVLRVMGADKRWVTVNFEDLSGRAQDRLIKQIKEHFDYMAHAA